jgi:hypothetical protein
VTPRSTLSSFPNPPPSALHERKVVALELLSLEAVAEGLEDLFVGVDDEVMEEDLRRSIATRDTVPLGRRTFDEWAGFWPTSDIELFASYTNRVEKFVITSTPLGQTWTNDSVVQGLLPEFMRSLRRDPAAMSVSTRALG